MFGRLTPESVSFVGVDICQREASRGDPNDTDVYYDPDDVDITGEPHPTSARLREEAPIS